MNNFATTESEIVEMGLRLAGTGNQVGLSEEQILALAAAMSSVGINAEAGGSSMSRVMQKINTEVLSGGDNLEKFAKVSGMSADEFSKKWKEEPEQAIVSFVDGLGKIKESGGDVTTALKEMGINSMQELDTLLRLSGASDTLSEALGISAEAWEENTALLDEAEQRYATTEAKIAILKNNITDLAITVGNELKSSLLDVIDTSVDMIDRLSTAFEEGGFSGLVEELGAVLADIVTMIAEATPQLFEMGTKMIMSFISGISENLPQIMESGFAIVNSLVNSIIEMLPMLLQLGIDLVVGLIEGIASGLPKMITVALDLVITLADKVIQNLPKIISAGLKLLEGLIKGIMDNLPKLIKEAPRIINDFANAIYKMLPKILLTGVKIILEIIKGLIKTIPTLVANIPQIIMAIVNVFTLYNFASVGKAAMTKLGGGIRSMVGNIASTARTLATNAINAIKGIFTQAPSIGSGFIRGVISGARSLGSSLAGIARSLGTRAISAIRGAFSGSSSIGSNMVKGIWNGISNVTGWILSKIRGFGSSVMKGIKGIFGIKSPSTVMRDQIGKNLVLGMGEGIEDEIPKLQRDLDKEMSKLTASMKNTVDFETGSLGNQMTATNQSMRYTVANSVEDAREKIGDTKISGNNFYIREEADVNKVARELEVLRVKKARG